MAQSTTARSADERGKIQTRQTTGTYSITEANTNGERRTKEAAASRSGKVCMYSSLFSSIFSYVSFITHDFSNDVFSGYYNGIKTSRLS
jgi:zona occludens toxin (predicted ATPase)